MPEESPEREAFARMIALIGPVDDLNYLIRVLKRLSPIAESLDRYLGPDDPLPVHGQVPRHGSP
ncbi:MAG: hypothetical protein NZ733_04920 [Aigarchaeota archaeon]|nr:hypothetical protein [Aigarchaeota archaeon]MDW8043727.1 hypothetical protein [Nitrososphaerota archaeon]